jgi:two-component system cell cycle sensor histidine kinase/response regulator CckA
MHATRILVVEDERIVARSLWRQLTTLGYEVVGRVSSGEEAIQQAEELRPDLVLMDISLDGPMDGVEAAAIIRKQFRLPVVYSSSLRTSRSIVAVTLMTALPGLSGTPESTPVRSSTLSQVGPC